MRAAVWGRHLLIAFAVGVSMCELSRRTEHPEGGAGGSADAAVVVTPPPVEVVAPVRAEPDAEEGVRTALAYQYEAPIFRKPDGKSVRGIVRRGDRIAISGVVQGEGCDGRWYAVLDGGYVCSTRGFNPSMGETSLSDDLATVPPAVNEPLPFEYAKILGDDRPLYWRLPSVAEEAKAQTPGARPEPVKVRSKGASFVALDRIEIRVEDDTPFVRTARGFYLPERDIQRKSPTAMHGEFIGPDARGLPMAFVHAHDVPILDEGGEPIGMAIRYSRFEVLGDVTADGRVPVKEGFLEREGVRIATAIPRPERIPEKAQWVDVDLTEQVLVAYEGDQPVRATLVSSGKAGHEPPLGVFQVEKKYTSKMMSGDDEIDGPYEVDQVPWIMYYWGSFALHGAYWHDGFGTPRSHGCTNIPPVDAQWLFRWAEPTLPPGWHGEVGVKGPYLSVRRSGE